MTYDVFSQSHLLKPKPQTTEWGETGEYDEHAFESELRLEQEVGVGMRDGVFYDTHHIFSQTFYPWYQNEKWNQVICPQPQHSLLHQVFGVMVPVQSVRFVRLFRSFAPGDSAGAVLAKLRAEFWSKERRLEKTRIYGDEKRFWEAILRRKERGGLFRVVFGDRTPWQTARLVEHYFALVGEAKKEEDVLAFLRETFWPTVWVGEKGEIPRNIMCGRASAIVRLPERPRLARRLLLSHRQ